MAINLQLPEFLTLKETAGLLRLSPVTVWRRIKSGDLACCDFGKRSCRIPRSAIDDFIKHSLRVSPGGGQDDC